MRLNRKWLYLGGLVTILTLLLTLTLVLPAGAAGTLDEGNLSSDKEFVSPVVDTGADDGLAARTVKVTLENTGLDSETSVEQGGGIDGVEIRVTATAGVPSLSNSRIRVNIQEDGAFPPTTMEIFLPTIQGADATPAQVLPIVGDVTIDVGAGSTSRTVAAKLGTPVVVNPEIGLIEIPIIDDLDGPDGDDLGDRIFLSYNTSKQETALINVRGEDDFDLLTVEGATTPAEYSETFVVRHPDDVRMSNGSVIHEQHRISSELRGYVKVDNERISNFYYVSEPGGDDPAQNEDAHDASTGRLSGAEAFQAAVSSAAGIATAQIFYARVASPPIRLDEPRAENGDISTEEVSITDDMNVETVDGVGVALVSAEQGILSFTTTGNFNGFPGNDIEVDYVGSDSFEIVVEHGPINLTGQTDLDEINLDDDWDTTEEGIQGAPGNDPITPGTIRLGLPTTDDDAAAPSAQALFELISISNDGNNCEDCRIRIGVITTPEDTDDGPELLNSRYSVLAISYSGLERFDLDDDLNNVYGPENDGMSTFSRTLEFAPYDMEPETDGVQDDIMVVRTSDSEGFPMPNDNIEVQSIIGRRVTFAVDSTGFTSTADPVEMTDGDTFDITYTRKVGALPQNALNPDAAARPVVAVEDGARIRVSSANDTITIDAEAAGPVFSNVAPAHGSGTGSNGEVLSIDVTDALSGVDEESIEFIVRSGSSVGQTVVNGDLTITAVEGGYQASIALNKVRHNGSGPTLNVSTSRETAINWYAKATDNAGNGSTSDSNRDKRDDATATNQYDDCLDATGASNDCYSFSVDGVSPTMQRAYTGDWFNEATDRVEGDRRVSRRNYLRGSSDNTSIRVVFNEALDTGSVSADDFSVDGSTPSDAEVFVGGDTDGASGPDTVNGSSASSVFLTVPAMPTDATPEVELTGSVSDVAGNPVSSGEVTALDGIAPSATLSVDKAIDQETVTVTVVTDEAVRLQSPDILLWVSDALDSSYDTELDETDTFTVGRENVDGLDDDTNPLVIRNEAGDTVYSSPLATAADLAVGLSSAPILDRNTQSRTGSVNGDDIMVRVYREEQPTLALSNVVTKKAAAETVVNAKTGQIILRIVGFQAAVVAAPNATPAVVAKAAVPALAKGDTIVVSYRGTGPDPANQFPSVPSVRGIPVSGSDNTWTYELDISRDDRFAVTAEMEDENLNRGTGGVADPNGRGAIVFEIDGELAADTDTDASSVPADDPTGATPVGQRDPFFIEISWSGEEDEYPGDGFGNVTLTKAVLDGTDVIDTAAAQDENTYLIRVDAISLGEHTLVYNGMDEAGNTNVSDRSLKFTVKESPTWGLALKQGMNLISLPSNPKDGSVEGVFGDSGEVDLIFTFDNGQALVAVRSPGTSEFAGTLKMIDARRAYWVRASNATTVEIDIPRTSQQVVLPNIAVKGGEWNLVPVLSLGDVDDKTAGRGAAPGTKIDADAYLGNFQTAFGWQNGSWMRIDPDPTTGSAAETRLENDITGTEDSDDPLLVGRGYWVLYTENAFIVPR